VTGISKLQLGNATIQDTTVAILDATSSREKKELLNKICSVDYLQQHRDAIIRHQDGTGKWFLQDPKYHDWTSSSRGTLVCPGAPGAGKTIMAALIIEQHLRAAQSARRPVAFIYYSYKRQDQQTLRHTLETILRQVVDGLPTIPEPVAKVFSQTPSIDELKNTLRELLEDCEELTIVTDALDECRDNVRSDVLSWITDLQASVPVRYLATTRDYYSDTFHSIFQDQPALEVKASRHDLELYTRFRARTLRAKVQPDLLEELIEGVVTAADGMYVRITSALGKV
jgi:Cdc6-like AAA superfamily ATPase